MKRQKSSWLRWLNIYNNDPFTTPVKSPFDYVNTILPYVRNARKNEIVEMSSVDDETIFIKSAMEVERVITYICDVLKKADLKILSEEELERLKKASPWEFWTCKEIQNIITKLVGGK